MPPCGKTSTLRSQKNGDFLLHRIAVPGSCTARPARQDPEKKPSFPTVSGGLALWSTPHAAGPQHGRSRYRFQGAKPVPYLASRRQGFQAVECAEHDNKKTRNKKHKKNTHRRQPPKELESATAVDASCHTQIHGYTNLFPLPRCLSNMPPQAKPRGALCFKRTGQSSVYKMQPRRRINRHADLTKGRHKTAAVSRSALATLSTSHTHDRPSSFRTLFLGEA